MAKICTHCRTKVRTEADRCPSCGASEFWYKCASCGKVSNTPVCPVCGWNPAHDSGSAQRQHQSVQYAPQIGQPQKKKASVWKILLWVFFLPIMGCIVIAKSPRFSTKLKAIFISGIALLTLLVATLGQGTKESDAAQETLKTIPSDSPMATIVPTETPVAPPAVIEDPQQPIVTPDLTAEPTIEPTIEPTAEPTPEPIKGYVNARSLNMRAEPSKDGDIVQECDGGQAVEIVGEEGDWYKVIVAGAAGYMMKEYVGMGDAPEKTEMPVTRTNAAAEEPQATYEQTTIPPQTAAPTATPIETPQPTGPTARQIINARGNYNGHVYGTKTGECYHYLNPCGNGNYFEITWEQASRLKPCDKCVIY